MTHAELLAEFEQKSASWPEETRVILRLLLQQKDPTEWQKELDELKKPYEEDKMRYEARIKELPIVSKHPQFIEAAELIPASSPPKIVIKGAKTKSMEMNKWYCNNQYLI